MADGAKITLWLKLPSSTIEMLEFGTIWLDEASVVGLYW